MHPSFVRPWAVGMALACGFLGSCANPDQRAANAPLTGGLGGAAVGAGIGSISGHAGSGALLGFMAGGLGGDVYRANAYSNRLIDPVGTARSSTAEISRGVRARADLRKRWSQLTLKVGNAGAQGDRHAELVARAEAARRAEECRMWQLRMKDIGRAMEYARSGRVPPPKGGFGQIARNAGHAAQLEKDFAVLRKSFSRMAK